MVWNLYKLYLLFLMKNFFHLCHSVMIIVRSAAPNRSVVVLHATSSVSLQEGDAPTLLFHFNTKKISEISLQR